MSEEIEKEEIDIELPDQETEVETSPPASEDKVEVSSQSSSDSGSAEEEVENYSKGVQKRIKKLTEKYRREERDREEAVRLAQVLRDENEQLKTQMQSSQQGYLNEYGSRLENQLKSAKAALKEAFDDGDADKLVEAQQALSKISIDQERHRVATVRQEKIKSQKDSEAEALVNSPPQQAQGQAPNNVVPDQKAEKWASRNEWFGENQGMTYTAMAIHKSLTEEEGFDPTSDEYYNELDRRIVTEFPHQFNGQKNGRSGQVASADTSASRKTTSGRRKVRLSHSQVEIARKLGVPLEEYAKYVKD